MLPILDAHRFRSFRSSPEVPPAINTERFSRTEGKTPAFVEGEVQRLLGVIETSTHTGLRDRALLGVLAYTFARIGAVVNLKVEDYYPSGKRFLFRFKEKGGKEKELPVHHKLEELLDQYLKASGLDKEPDSPLFPAALGKTGKFREKLVDCSAKPFLFVLYVQITSQRKEISLFEFENRRAASV